MAEVGDPAVGAGRPPTGWKRLSLALAVAAALLVMGANAHLVYVAVGSQPDCVLAADENAPFKAATPAC